MDKKDDLISRAALIETFERFMNQPDTQPLVRAFMTSVICITENAPAVDAEPVWHGWWNAEYEYEDFLHASCSVCNEESKYMHKYCPNCGAKMDLKEGTE